jgi:hypothetical protein
MRNVLHKKFILIPCFTLCLAYYNKDSKIPSIYISDNSQNLYV